MNEKQHYVISAVRMAASGEPVSSKCACGGHWEGPSSFVKINAHLDKFAPTPISQGAPE